MTAVGWYNPGGTCTCERADSALSSIGCCTTAPRSGVTNHTSLTRAPTSGGTAGRYCPNTPGLSSTVGTALIRDTGSGAPALNVEGINDRVYGPNPQVRPCHHCSTTPVYVATWYSGLTPWDMVQHIRLLTSHLVYELCMDTHLATLAQDTTDLQMPQLLHSMCGMTRFTMERNVPQLCVGGSVITL